MTDHQTTIVGRLSRSNSGAGLVASKLSANGKLHRELSDQLPTSSALEYFQTPDVLDRSDLLDVLERRQQGLPNINLPGPDFACQQASQAHFPFMPSDLFHQSSTRSDPLKRHQEMAPMHAMPHPRSAGGMCHCDTNPAGCIGFYNMKSVFSSLRLSERNPLKVPLLKITHSESYEFWAGCSRPAAQPIYGRNRQRGTKVVIRAFSHNGIATSMVIVSECTGGFAKIA